MRTKIGKYLIVIALVVVFAAVILGTFLFYGFHHPQRESLPSASTSISSPSSTAACFESTEYFLIDNNPGLPGLDLIVKHKTDPSEVIPCGGAVAPGDVVVQNDLPEFVLGLIGKFIIVDSGTAPPPRGLKIYDLDAQRFVYNDRYSDITIASGSVVYWEPIKQAITAANCPGLAQYTAEGLGEVMESHVMLDLATLTKKESGEYRCVPTQ